MEKPNKSNSIKKRANHEEREERYRNIEALMDQGYRPADIVRVISQRYGISHRQAERDVLEVRKLRSQALLLNPPSALRAEHYHQLDHIYRESLRKTDLQTALKALALKEELIHKHQTTERPKHASTDSPPVSAEEMDALMATLEREWPG